LATVVQHLFLLKCNAQRKTVTQKLLHWAPVSQGV